MELLIIAAVCAILGGVITYIITNKLNIAKYQAYEQQRRTSDT
jgi:membrane protein YqaA with SNARE-associated domain